MAEAKRGGKKNRKHGRNALKCKAYRDRDQEAKNAEKRQARHLKNLAKVAARKGG